MVEPIRDIDETPESPRARLLIESALRTLETEASGISALAAAVNGALAEPIVAAIEMIRAARGRLIVTGMGKSGHIGRSGETVELKDLINYSRRFRINLIGITASAESALAVAADVALVLPQVREACPHNLAPTTSSLLQLALGDVLAVALLESRGFTAFDFRAFHPSGKLGAMLGFVRDIMQTGDAVPLAPLGTKVSDAITQMSRRGSGCAAGCVGITDHDGKLVGIITDGDLRRNMRPDLLDLAVDAIMTRDPKTVAPDQLVSEAMEMLNASKVSVLLVVENARAVGIVHFHHLLRAGVA